MANPQKENGFTPIANEVLEELVKARLLGAELSMTIFVIRKTWGYQKKDDIISFSQFQRGLGISRMTISKTIKNLVLKNILVKTPILGDKTSFSFNKNYEKWLVNTPLLVKDKRAFGKGAYTKTSKGAYTHKRKKENTKESTEQSSGQIVSLIKAFEGVNPSAREYYARVPQRKACISLIDLYGFERVLMVVEKTLPRTNKIEYMPTIISPVQLFEKWSSLEAGILKLKAKENHSNEKYPII